MFKLDWKIITPKFVGLLAIVIVVVLGLSLLFYQVAFAGKILMGVKIGVVDVGWMTKAEAAQKLNEAIDNLFAGGISINIGDNDETIWLENINFSINREETLSHALAIGRQGGIGLRVREWISSLYSNQTVYAAIEYDNQILEGEFEILSLLYDVPLKDIRLEIKNNEVSVLEDTQSGKIINQVESKKKFLDSMKRIDESQITLYFQEDLPQINIAFVDVAKKEAERIITEPLALVYQNKEFIISIKQLQEWILSGSDGEKLKVILDEPAISFYVAQISDDINVDQQNLDIEVENGKVVRFIPPKSGELLEQDQSIQLILEALDERREGKFLTSRIELPVVVKKPIANETAASLGIIEKIGSATTPFTGSPPNRVHNIKNGAKFLTGVLVPPGEEFSTIGALGTIDNTTGYLPELVIKGDRTIPEFGGGLCQVSTTLFRAVLNSGLSVSGRQNHSYRVPYYEYDGDGNFIGPGLDATIYDPNPDFKFINDTENYVLIQGIVQGDKITFNLYGTKDGRTAKIDGPYILSEIPPGDPIYTETDELLVGETKRLESAHPGGSAIATYEVTYSNGEVKTEVFKSFYRKWPARYLVGTGTKEE